MLSLYHYSSIMLSVLLTPTISVPQINGGKDKAKESKAPLLCEVSIYHPHNFGGNSNEPRLPNLPTC